MGGFRVYLHVKCIMRPVPWLPSTCHHVTRFWATAERRVPLYTSHIWVARKERTCASGWAALRAQSLTEHRSPDTLTKLRKAETALKKAMEDAYLDSDKAEEEKAQGNEFFKASKVLTTGLLGEDGACCW